MMSHVDESFESVHMWMSDMMSHVDESFESVHMWMRRLEWMGHRIVRM